MKPIKITVLSEGIPVEGAEVIAGEYAQKGLNTDANGEINGSVEDNFVIATPVIVRVDHIVRAVSGPMVLEADGDYVFDIGFSTP